MKKSAIYVRVSTHHQIDKDSLPLQKQDLINYSKFILNINNYEIFEDAGFSGKNTDRPAFQDMMDKIRKREFTHLLVWKIDRISRNLLNFCDMYEEMKKYNCTFVSKNEQFDTSSAMGEAMLKIILVFAELERKLTGERVKSVMLSRAEKGLWNGAPIPLGYKWDEIIKFPVIDLDEKLIVELIYNKYMETKSTSSVRNILNNTGIKTKRNGNWTTKTIADIIRNCFYKGTYRYNYRETARGKIKDEKEWIILENNHSPIISKELWQQCNDIMDINAKRNNAIFRKNLKVHVFAGLLQCGECKKNLYAKQDKPNSDGYIPSLYVCSSRYNQQGCSQRTINDNYIGTFVLNYLSNILNISKHKEKNLSIEILEKQLLKGVIFKDVIGIDNNSLEELQNILLNTPNEPFKVKKNAKTMPTNNFELEKLDKEKFKYKRALERLEDLYLFDNEDMSQKDYLVRKTKLTNKLDEINKQIKQFNDSNILPSDQLNFLSESNVILLREKILNTEYIEYKPLVLDLGRDILKDFVNATIDKIVVKDKKITKIIFKNRLINKFIYIT